MASEGRYQVIVQVTGPTKEEQMTEGVTGMLCKMAGWADSDAGKSYVHFMASKARGAPHLRAGSQPSALDGNGDDGAWLWGVSV